MPVDQCILTGCARNKLIGRIAELEERLEISHGYIAGPEGTLVRKELSPAERASFPDAVSCRDETIKLRDERIAELEKELAGERERLDYMQTCMLAADFDYGERHECVLVFRWPVSARVCANLRKNIDAAKEPAA